MARRRSASSWSCSTACACISESKTSWRPFPAAFARYMAVSASRRRSIGFSYAREPTAMPMLVVMSTSSPWMSKGSRRVWWILSATRVASVTSPSRSRTTPNSSPPRRATVSPGRTQSLSRRLMAMSSWSPARCPRLSLTRLKRSKSRKSTANLRSRPERRARSRRRLRCSMKVERFGRPVSSSWVAS